MKTITSSCILLFLFPVLIMPASCSAAPVRAQAAHAAPKPVRADDIVIAKDPGRALPPYAFSDLDDALLDEIQRGALAYFLHSTDPTTGMVYDRSSTDTISVAGVGYQLAALVIGVDRGWIERADAEELVRRILPPRAAAR